MKYFTIEPEVAGNIANYSEGDLTKRPPIVNKLHYEFEGWPEDVLIESLVCFIVTSDVAADVAKGLFTGGRIEEVEVSRSEFFEEEYHDRALPEFKWLQVHGQSHKDDMAISPKHQLVVSERFLEYLKRKGIGNADFIESEAPTKE
jgi:hypothetical protein